jgi:hypothetical protein
MQILSEIIPITDRKIFIDQYQYSLYPISNSVIKCVTDNLLPGKTVILFSGHHRFNFDAVYIEPTFLSTIAHPKQNSKIIFANQSDTKLLNYILKKMHVTNLLVLNTASFIKYRSWQEIKNDIYQLKELAEQVIVTLPLNRFDFNRLKYSSDDIATKLGGVVLDNTVVVACR